MQSSHYNTLLSSSSTKLQRAGVISHWSTERRKKNSGMCQTTISNGEYTKYYVWMSSRTIPTTFI